VDEMEVWDPPVGDGRKKKEIDQRPVKKNNN
jgi:hypothetical protein